VFKTFKKMEVLQFEQIFLGGAVDAELGDDRIAPVDYRQRV